MNTIKAVIFDQGGVLSLGGRKGTNEEAVTRGLGLRTTVEIPDLLEDLKQGAITNKQFVAEVNRLYPDAPQRLTDAVWDKIYATLQLEPRAYDLAQQCRKAGLHVGLLSNINPAIAERLKAAGAYDGFDPCVLSCYVGCAKPDPRIYDKVEVALPGIRPGSILLLDDQDKCVRGARARGWQAIQVLSPAQMVRDVDKLLNLR